MKPRISKRTVDALVCPPDKDRVFLWDGAIPGFGIVAFPTGAKIYVIQYRKAGKSHRHKIGRHGHLTPEQARTEAKKLLGEIASGKNPAAERKAAREIRTFESVAREFVHLHLRAKKKPRSAIEFARLLDHDILPAIGKMRVTDITRLDVSRFHTAMREKPVLANKCLIVISAVWGWAGRQGEVDAAKNPATGIDRYREQRRERLLSGDELGRIGDALAEAEAEYPWSVATIRLLALTGCRLNEILTARWDYLDMERGMLHLPDSKTGRKSVVLNAAALEVIAAISASPAREYIIAGLRPDKPRSPPQRFWRQILKDAKVEGVRIHDLRHNFATVGAGAQMGLPVIGKLLGHATPSTTQRYAHLADNPLRAASETIGAQIDAAMNRKKPAEIVELKPVTK